MELDLRHARFCHQVLDTITSECEMKVCSYELTQEEWDIATHLCKVLKVCDLFLLGIDYSINHLPKIFKDATLFFSRGTPNIATVIPAMDHIDTKLATDASNDKYPLSIQAALAMGKKTLNRYYNKTDHSEIFRIAMGMPPFIVLNFNKLLTNSQFSTLVTNCNILKMSVGRRIGSRLRKILCELSLIVNMRQSRVLSLCQHLERYVPLFFLHFGTLLILSKRNRSWTQRTSSTIFPHF
jgi:hypothetical protein